MPWPGHRPGPHSAANPPLLEEGSAEDSGLSLSEGCQGTQALSADPGRAKTPGHPEPTHRADLADSGAPRRISP